MLARFFAFPILVTSLIFTVNAQQVYVDSTSSAPSPDGTSWTTAFPMLQDALDLVTPGDTIWVAKGTYFPTVEFDADSSGGSDPRERTFYLNVNRIVIYGGFQGNETLLSQRNIAANPTILSGDIGMKGDSTDNSYHVLFIDGTSSNGAISSATLIDGFTITEGNADRFFPSSLGGGMYLNGRGTGNEVSLSIANCHFTQNTANSGGAVYNNGADGGKSSPSYLNVEFTENRGGASAGAAFNRGTNNGVSSPTFTNCLFFQNSADFGGGAMVNAGEIGGESSPKLINCTFSRNRCPFGAAIENAASGGGRSTPIIANCIIWGNLGRNSATNFGDQIQEILGSRSQITFSIVNGIDTLQNQPAAWVNNSCQNPQFINPVMGDLGLLAISPAVNAGSNDSIPTNISLDLGRNARIIGGTVDMGAFERNILNLTRLYVDSASVAPNPDGASWATAFPLLQSALDIVTLGDTIWVANGTYFPTKDRFGDANPANDRNKTFYLNTDDVEIYGGFAGTETQIDQRDVEANLTILNGDLGVPMVFDDNAYHVVYIDGTTSNGPITNLTRIDGFTITEGLADSPLGPNNIGAGMYINGRLSGNEASPTITNCTFINNNAIRSGGAIYNSGFNRGTSNTIISDCDFILNSAALDGGAILNDGFTRGESSPVITNCTFTQNFANQFGGAIHNLGINGTSSPTLTNCTFEQNRALQVAGAIYNNGDNGVSSPLITNCLFYRNSSFQVGAVYNNGVTNGESSPVFTNCTFGKNRSNLFGAVSNNGTNGGIANPILTNCILWENLSGLDSTSFTSQVNDSMGTSSILTHCLANGLVSGIGNLSADPLFVNADTGNFRLMMASPAVNAGINDSIPVGITTDLVGSPRILRSTVDMGAYESDFSTSIDPINSRLTTLRAFPNPVSDQLVLEWEINPTDIRVNQVLTAQLYDLQGKNVRTYTLPQTASAYVLKLGDLPSSVYTLKVAGSSIKVLKR